MNISACHLLPAGNYNTMAYNHNEGAAPGGRHMSVSHYEQNVGLPTYDGGRRRSSIVPAGSISGGRASQASNVLNQKDETLRKMSVAVPNLAELSADAKVAAEAERNMGFREGVKLYPKAMFFSFGLSLAVVMEGYDTWLLGNFYGMSSFQKSTLQTPPGSTCSLF